MYAKSCITRKFFLYSIEYNIDLNVKNANGKTAFHLACESADLTKIKLILDNAEFLDLTIKDNEGRTGYQLAKHLAKERNYVSFRKELRDVIKLIENYGCGFMDGPFGFVLVNSL